MLTYETPRVLVPLFRSYGIKLLSCKSNLFFQFALSSFMKVFVLFEASDRARAKELTNAPDLKEKMEASGVQGQPDIVLQ